MIARDIYEVLFCDDINFWEATKDLYKKLDNKKLHNLMKRLKKTEAKIFTLEKRYKESTGKKRKNFKRKLYFKKRLHQRLLKYINLYFENA